LANHRISPNDILTNAMLRLLDKDIAQGNVVPVDAEYLERLTSLAGDASINMDERLPPEVGSNGSQDGAPFDEPPTED